MSERLENENAFNPLFAEKCSKLGKNVQSQIGKKEPSQ